MEKFKAFEAALQADEALQKRYEAALKEVDIKEASCDGEVIRQAAAKVGYDIPLEELEQAWAAVQEMDESEFTAVTGGARGQDEDEYLHDHVCWVGWHCFVAMMHTESEDHMCAC